MLSRKDLQALGHEENGTYYFDLSEISCDVYTALLKAIESYGSDSITQLVFSCSQLAECDESSGKITDIVRNSIALKVKGYARKLTQTIVNLIKTSRVLNSIHLISTDSEVEELVAICQATQKSHSLKALEFTDINIFDRNIKPIAVELSKTKIKSAIFKHCGLSDCCIPVMVKYAEIAKKRGLREIDLTDNEISPKEFAKVVAALNNNTEVNVNREEEERKLEKENDALRTEIARLKGIIQEVEARDALFIVGDGAKELVAKMKQIDKRVTLLERDS